jgi:hypothetical protein
MKGENAAQALLHFICCTEMTTVGIRKIPLPLRYVYGFVAAALVGTFTIVGLGRILHTYAAQDGKLQPGSPG